MEERLGERPQQRKLLWRDLPKSLATKLNAVYMHTVTVRRVSVGCRHRCKIDSKIEASPYLYKIQYKQHIQNKQHTFNY